MKFLTSFLIALMFNTRNTTTLAMDNFSEYQFKRSVAKALESVESILDTTRNPVLPEDAEHTYEDKYALAEFVVNSAIASYGNVLHHIGVKDNVLDQALHWYQDDKSTVELQFEGKTWSEFVKEEERMTTDSETETDIVTKLYNAASRTKTETVKVKTKVFDLHHTLNIQLDFKIKTKDSSITVITHSAKVPFVFISAHQGERKLPINTNTSENNKLSINWLLEMLSDGTESNFSIDRKNESCKTPRRNEGVERSLEFSRKLEQWSHQVNSFMSTAQSIAETYLESAKRAQRSNPQTKDDDIFVPIVPLFENGTVLSMDDLNEFMHHQVKTLSSASENAINKFSEVDFFSPDQISLGVSSRHLISLHREMLRSLDYVEHMLETQLFQAIGKHIQASDFDKFMQFHNQRFFGQEYAPQPFSYSVRRPGYYPDGAISIGTRKAGAGTLEPIETLVRKIPREKGYRLSIPIDSATKVDLDGDVYLHGYMQHIWNGDANGSQDLEIDARAQQFSSFLLIIGVMGGSNVFLPKHAIVLQDKDEVIIRLITNVLPSAKAFKDAIASLSPEQQEFARAFRSMQLETSVFGVCVIQLKPQLEKLLQLPEHSLSKEIQLTQDLMSLFIEYQIPSDLLSFDGSEDLPTAEKIEAVRDHVGAVLTIIDSQKKAQLQEAKDEYKAEKMMSRPVPPVQQQRAMMMDGNVHRRLKTASAETMSYEFGSINDVPESSLLSAEFEEIDASKSMFDDVPAGEQGQSTMSNTTIEEFDPTMIPRVLDQKLEKHDKDGALKSTIVQVRDGPWERLRKKNLLVAAQRSLLHDKDKKHENHKAMDLLTAISRSGSLPIVQSELHIIVAVSHCFQNDVVGTVIRDNVNPIRKVEQSLLMLGSIIYEKDYDAILAPSNERGAIMENVGNEEAISKA